MHGLTHDAATSMAKTHNDLNHAKTAADADVYYGRSDEFGDPGIAMNYADSDHKAVYNGLGTDGTCEVCGKPVLFDGFGAGNHLDPNTEVKWRHVKTAAEACHYCGGMANIGGTPCPECGGSGMEGQGGSVWEPQRPEIDNEYEAWVAEAQSAEDAGLPTPPYRRGSKTAADTVDAGTEMSSGGKTVDPGQVPGASSGSGNIYDVSNYDTYDRSYVVTEPNPAAAKVSSLFERMASSGCPGCGTNGYAVGGTCTNCGYKPKSAEFDNTCPVCGGPGFFGDICMGCVKSRARAAQDGRCHCGNKRIPGEEKAPFGPRGRKWIPCERCLGTIKQTGSKVTSMKTAVHTDPWEDAYGIAWIGASNPKGVQNTVDHWKQQGLNEDEMPLRAMQKHLDYLNGDGLGPEWDDLTAINDRHEGKTAKANPDYNERLFPDDRTEDVYGGGHRFHDTDDDWYEEQDRRGRNQEMGTDYPMDAEGSRRTAEVGDWECYGCGKKLDESELLRTSPTGFQCPACKSYEVHINWGKDAARHTAEGPRKITKMQFCDKHAGRFAGETRYRQAETMVEGGWANGGPCSGGTCKLWPGTDIFEPSICEGEFPLDWTGKTATRRTAALVPGPQLTPQQKRNVLNAFPYRWTTENSMRTQAWGTCPKCDIKDPYVNTESANGHSHPTMPLQSDEQWLNEHAFHLNQNGQLSGNHSGAEPYYGGTTASQHFAYPKGTVRCGGCMGSGKGKWVPGKNRAGAAPKAGHHEPCGGCGGKGFYKLTSRTAAWVVRDTATNTILDGPYDDKDAANLALSRASQGSAGFLSESLVVEEHAAQEAGYRSDVGVSPWSN
jgi:hypothetical protein